MQTYCCYFYGSNIWNLYSEYACQTYRSWSTTVKVCWNLPQPTHTYFVKNFSKEFNSVRVLLLRRFAKFAQSILHSWNPLIWQVGSISAYSLQYDFGSNISNISDEFFLDILNIPPRAISEELGRSPFKKKIILNVYSISCYSAGNVKKTTLEKN